MIVTQLSRKPRNGCWQRQNSVTTDKYIPQLLVTRNARRVTFHHLLIVFLWISVVHMDHWTNKTLRLTLLLLLASVGAYGCLSDSSADDPEPRTEFSALGAEFSELVKSTNTSTGIFTQKSTKVLDNQEDFLAELAMYTSVATEDVDFSNHKVLLVDMGQRNSGGYEIAVEQVEDHPDYVAAKVKLSKPAEDCIVSAVLSNPYQFIQITTRKEVLVVEELEIVSCG